MNFTTLLKKKKRNEKRRRTGEWKSWQARGRSLNQFQFKWPVILKLTCIDCNKRFLFLIRKSSIIFSAELHCICQHQCQNWAFLVAIRWTETKTCTTSPVIMTRQKDMSVLNSFLGLIYVAESMREDKKNGPTQYPFSMNKCETSTFIYSVICDKYDYLIQWRQIQKQNVSSPALCKHWKVTFENNKIVPFILQNISLSAECTKKWQLSTVDTFQPNLLYYNTRRKFYKHSCSLIQHVSDILQLILYIL